VNGGRERRRKARWRGAAVVACRCLVRLHFTGGVRAGALMDSCGPCPLVAPGPPPVRLLGPEGLAYPPGGCILLALAPVAVAVAVQVPLGPVWNRQGSAWIGLLPWMDSGGLWRCSAIARSVFCSAADISFCGL
jgi:hypothetical protein